MAIRLSLSDQANAIMTLLVALKQNVDPTQDDQSKANELVNSIRTLNDTLVALLELDSLAERLGNAATRTEAFADIEQLITIDSGVALSTFFKQVGSAVIQAQQELDLEFERDLRAMQTNPPEDRLAPVQYAIPTVHAEMKVGFSQVSSRGINLLVFNNSQQKQNYSESTISFDIVAAPAPPSASRIPPEPPPPRDIAGTSRSASSVPLERAAGVKLPPLAAASSRTDEAGGLILESKRLPRGTVAAKTPAVAVGPAFPLRGESRSEALTALEEKLTPGDRRIVHAQTANGVIVPSSLAAGARQTLLYLFPGTKRGKTSTDRAFRCYLGDRTPAALVLRALRRPDAVGRKDLARRGLLVPASIGPKDRAALPDIIGGVGAVLMRLVESANNCKPACILHPDVEEQAARIESISSRLPDAVPPLVPGEPWAVFVDGAGSSRVREYVVVRGIYAPTTREWREMHVIGISPNPRRGARTGTPHIHIPDADTVASWKGTDAPKLEAVAATLEPLLRRLTAIVDANR